MSRYVINNYSTCADLCFCKCNVNIDIVILVIIVFSFHGQWAMDNGPGGEDYGHKVREGGGGDRGLWEEGEVPALPPGLPGLQGEVGRR